MSDARALMTGAGYRQGTYQSDSTVTRLSHKMFGCTPEQLPPDLQGQLAVLLGAQPQDLQGYIRPGCASMENKWTKDLIFRIQNPDSLRSDPTTSW